MRFPKFILGIPSIFVLILFFLPWLTISCAGIGNRVTFINASGFNLALGDIEFERSAFEDPTFGMSDMFGFDDFNDIMFDDLGGIDNFGEFFDVADADLNLGLTDGDYELLLIPLLSLFALGLIFVSDRLLKGLYLGTAAAALAVWVLYLLEVETDLRSTFRGAIGFEMSYGIAFWLTGGLLGLMILLGLIFDNDAV